jgi:hypothetical protein
VNEEAAETPRERLVQASGERSVAAGRDVGQVATGDFVTQVGRATVLPGEALALGPVAGPVRYLPERTAQFVGRRRELALLDEAFDSAGGVVVHAVHGLGGVGKSTLAAHWAAGRAATLNPVWWITAESRAQLDAGLADLGRALHPSLVGTLPEDALRERTTQWLASNDGWLVVLDNVSDPAVVKPLLARAPGGRFLITTRLSATSWRGLGRTLDLDVLELAEAVELFTRIYDGSADGVEELCGELGCLPLAIDQAAAYCREAGITPRAYLELLARRPAKLYAAGPEGGDAERTIARVWRVTLDRLADTPAASLVLRTIAWWGPDGIPRAYLEPAEEGAELDVTEAIRRLAAHSMIRLRDGTISVHRLVQAVARTPDPSDPYRTEERIASCRRIAVRLLSMAQGLWFQRSEADAFRVFMGVEGRVWAMHVEALADRYPRNEDTAQTARLFGTAGMRLGMDVQYRRSLALCERALDAALHACGPDDELTRATRGWLAQACVAVDDVDRALELRTQVLSDCMRLLGPDHQDTIDARDELVLMLRHAGRHQRAVELAQENAREAGRVLGESHPRTDGVRATLSVLLTSSRSGGQAEEPPLQIPGGTRTGSRDAEELLDSLDPMELIDLATEAFTNGETPRAVAVIGIAVERSLRDFGETSSPTLLARGFQVVYLRYSGDHERADELALGVSDDAVRALGDTDFTRMLRGLVAHSPSDDAS